MKTAKELKDITAEANLKKKKQESERLKEILAECEKLARNGADTHHIQHTLTAYERSVLVQLGYTIWVKKDDGYYQGVWTFISW